MMRPALPLSLSLVLALQLTAPALRAEPGWQKTIEEQPFIFNEELRDFLYDTPSVIENALKHQDDMKRSAVWAPLQDEIDSDVQRITLNGDALFAASAAGLGASGQRAVITLFTAAGCDDCVRAEAELAKLAAKHPDMRFEIRSAADTPDDRLALALARDKGAGAAIRFRKGLAEGSTPAALLSQAGEDPAALRARAEAPALARTVADQADLFGELQLDTAPSYVMQGRLIRGRMPSVVLERYIERATPPARQAQSTPMQSTPGDSTQ